MSDTIITPITVHAFCVKAARHQPGQELKLTQGAITLTHTLTAEDIQALGLLVDLLGPPDPPSVDDLRAHAPASVMAWIDRLVFIASQSSTPPTPVPTP